MTALIIICAVFLACFVAMLVATHNAMPYDPSWDEDEKDKEEQYVDCFREKH